MRKRLFIDGEAGTTGLEIFSRLHDRPDLEILRLAPDRRKDSAARADALNGCDLAVLCLPDDAAIEEEECMVVEVTAGVVPRVDVSKGW